MLIGKNLGDPEDVMFGGTCGVVMEAEDLSLDEFDVDFSFIEDNESAELPSDIAWMESLISPPMDGIAIGEEVGVENETKPTKRIRVVLPRRSKRNSVRGFRFPTEYSLGSFSREGGVLPCLFKGSEMILSYDALEQVYTLLDSGKPCVEFLSTDICNKLKNGTFH